MYATIYLKAKSLRNEQRYAAPVRPLTLVDIDPSLVEFVADSFYLPKYRRAGSVVNGNWDALNKRYEDTAAHRALVAHWESNEDWENTAYYHKILDEINYGNTPWGCSSRSDLELRCQQLDELYETIKEEGYRTQHHIHDNDVSDPIDRGRSSLIERILNDEVAVDIGRNGEILFSDGRHRMSIAKILDIDEISMLILIRHGSWQQYRDWIYRGTLSFDDIPTTIEDHPDIEDLV